MELEDRREAAVPLVMLLFQRATRLLYEITGLKFSRTIRSEVEINHLFLDLIYEIHYFHDHLVYDFIRPHVDDLQFAFRQARSQDYSELHSAVQLLIKECISNRMYLKEDVKLFIKRVKWLSKKRVDLISKLDFMVDLPADSIREKFDDFYKMFHGICKKVDEINNILERPLLPCKRLFYDGGIHQEHLETFPYSEEDSVVIGRDKEKDKILEWLSPGTQTTNNFSSIAIVGQGGLGKTTLAQLVFNDEWVSKHFNLRLWIHVSDTFDVEIMDTFDVNIMKKMIDGARGIPNVSENFTSPVFILMRVLEGKKLLLVLDDVWNESPSLWESLKFPLLAAEYVRVIVTTRNASVAEIMQTTDPVRLRYLSEGNSLEILKQCAFQYQSPEKLPALIEMGKRIVKKCGGLPLTVKALATYLRFKHDGAEHIDAIPNEVLMNTIFPSLKISYNHLSTLLKCCFIYCSMFPECYSFTKDELVRLWIAQGYFMEYSIDIEGFGNKCFDKLHKSSFFDLSHCEANAVMVFTIPVFIHALAKHIAGNEYLALDDLRCIPKNVHHLYVGSGEIVKHLSPGTATGLHTFVLLATTFHGATDFILDMTRVRALVLIMHNIPELPGSIGNALKPLRYLRVESYLIEKLPESIVNLCHLQVLDVSYSRKLKELPQEIGRLINLRTLCLNGCTNIQELPNTLRDLCSLQNLCLIGSSMKWMHPAIRELTELRRLHYKLTTCFTNSNSLS